MSGDADTGRARLRAFLRRRPDALETMSLRAIGREVDLSGERVRQLLPGPPRTSRDLAERRRERRLRALQPALRRFVRANPRAILPRGAGGLTLKAIGELLSADPKDVAAAWRRLGLPARASQTSSPAERSRRWYARHKTEKHAQNAAWRARNPERWRAIQRRADAKHRAKVLREERCIVCGGRFPWTVGRESQRRQKGGRVVCSRQCGRVAADRARQAARRKVRSSPRR